MVKENIVGKTGSVAVECETAAVRVDAEASTTDSLLETTNNGQTVHRKVSQKLKRQNITIR